MLLAVKNYRQQQQQNLPQSPKLTTPLLPSTPQAAEPIAKHAVHAGWTLLLLAAGEDRQFFLLAIKNDR